MKSISGWAKPAATRMTQKACQRPRKSAKTKATFPGEMVFIAKLLCGRKKDCPTGSQMRAFLARTY
jgi:hypothetical protein